MTRQLGWLIVAAAALAGCESGEGSLRQALTRESDAPFVVVLGAAQDGGYPQAGTGQHPAWLDPSARRHATCLGLVDPQSGERWMIEATPDFREQLHALDVVAPTDDRPGLAGILLTHAHMGHYTGLMHLGHEAMGARGVPVNVMPRMARYLRTNGPWEQLVRYGNIELRPLADGIALRLNARLSATPFAVPHRQEYSEVVGFRLDGPRRSVLFLPDIDSWEELDLLRTSIEDLIGEVDVAYLDATFYADGEIPGRDMSGFPHPFIVHSMERFGGLPADERSKIRFIHLNHTNPAWRADSEARREIESAGFRLATEGERVAL